MATYPFLTQIAWDVVNRLTLDWQTRPHLWEREVDIQSELASRLRSVLTSLGREISQGYSRSTSRVACEPSVRYTYSDSRQYTCQPDVVIRNDQSENLPEFAWLCEIKYDQNKGADWDIEKLIYLCSQNIVQYGCWINISSSVSREASIVWGRHSGEDRVWTCNVSLPKIGE